MRCLSVCFAFLRFLDPPAGLLIGCVLSAAYTMFNVYLPKLLEGRGNADEGTAPKSLSDSLWDVVIYSIGGCPGAIVSNLSPRPHTESSC